MIFHVICLPIYIKVNSLALGQLYDCQSASEESLKNMGKLRGTQNNKTYLLLASKPGSVYFKNLRNNYHKQNVSCVMNLYTFHKWHMNSRYWKVCYPCTKNNQILKSMELKRSTIMMNRGIMKHAWWRTFVLVCCPLMCDSLLINITQGRTTQYDKDHILYQLLPQTELENTNNLHADCLIIFMTQAYALQTLAIKTNNLIILYC